MRIPRLLVSSALSNRSALSWLCGVTTCRSYAQTRPAQVPGRRP
ncbi:hypothetical protein FHX45_000668 [Amycolatopsis granulosa]|nr:hypothetical protein [Amycolatopsis granulosa]